MLSRPQPNMIELDGFSTNRIQSSHQPPPYSSFHHHLSASHHQQLRMDSSMSHSRLNSLLTKPAAPPPLPSISDIVNSSHHNSNNRHHSSSSSHHQNGSSHSKKSSSDSSSRSHHSSHSSKKHSQIVSKLQQSISSRMKQSSSHGGHHSATSAQQHQDQQQQASHHSRTSSAASSLPHSQLSTNATTMSASIAVAPPAAVVATKSSLHKISTSNQHASAASSVPLTAASAASNSQQNIEHESAAAMKKKKKSHLSRDELSRVCQNGDVTFENYNGSTYMIAIRSMGDRKSLIGYRCDWNNCGYMNARVERMFGHIRSQHPEAPTVKKLVTTSGPTMTTSTVTTSTSHSSSSPRSKEGGSNTSTTSSSTSARLSLRSSSSLSTASSVSSCSLSPRSQKSATTTTHSSSTTTPTKCNLSPNPAPSSASPTSNSTLLNALSSSKSRISPVNGSESGLVKAKKSHSKPVACKAEPATSLAHDALDHLESVVQEQQQHDASPSHIDAAFEQAETSQHHPEDDKLIDLLSQTSASAHIKEEAEDDNCNNINTHHEESVHDDLIDIGLGEIKVEIHHSSPLMEALSSGSLVDPAASTSAAFDPDDKLAALSSAELTESTERIMQELKTISGNYSADQVTVGAVNSSPHSADHFGNQSSVHSAHHSPVEQHQVDRNNNHHATQGVMGVSVNECNPVDQQSVGGNLEAVSNEGPNSNVHPPVSHSIKVEDPLPMELFDEDIESLLNEHVEDIKPPPSYHQPSSHDSYLDSSDHKFSVEPASMMVEHQQSPSLAFQGQPQQQQHTPSPPLHQQPGSMGGHSMDHHSDHSNYDNYSHMNEYSYDGANNNSNSSMNDNSLEYSNHHVRSNEHMIYDGDASYDDMDPSIMLDDGSNGSNGSASGKSRPGGKKGGSSKNYIGKQNLFQEFQSDEVAKVRDSENKYIIALQKNMKIVGYRCDWPECEFLTCRKYVMVNHINGKHTNQRPYSCPLCNFNFVKRYFLKAHMHKVHKRRISLDKDDEDDAPSSGGKREHELLEAFDEGQYEEDETPSTPVVAPPPPPPPSKKPKTSNTSPSYAQSQGPSGGYYGSSNGHAEQSSFSPQYSACPPPPNPSSDYPASDNIPSTVQQFHSNYNSSSTSANSYPTDPMISGRQSMNGNSNGCFYGDDSAYGSDISPTGSTLAASAPPTFKQSPTAAINNSSAVFMTPSPSTSSSIASPFSATGPSTPNPKCGYGTPMYDSASGSFECGVVPQQSAMYPASGPNYNQQPSQQPFLSRSYSTSNQSSQIYPNQAALTKSHSVGSNPMLAQTDLLTPPLSVSTVNGSNCCRGSSAPNGIMTVNGSADMFQQQQQDSFFESSMSQTGYSSAPNSFDDFLSPPSSISSSGSNFSGSYMANGMCDSKQSSGGVSSQSSVNTQQRQAPVVGCSSMSSIAPTSSNASPFYMHTPSPSPSSLNHSPASASVYAATHGMQSSGANGYGSMTASQQAAYQQQLQQQQQASYNYQSADSMSMAGQSYPTAKASVSNYPTANGGNGFISSHSQQQSLRQQQQQQQQAYASSNSMYGSSASYQDAANCYFDQEPSYGPVMSNSSAAVQRAQAAKSAASYYGANGYNTASANNSAANNQMSQSMGHHGGYMDTYPSMPQSKHQSMYSTNASSGFMSTGPECWNAAGW